MVIDEINVVHVASFKPKGDPPVARNRDAPQSSEVPSEGMQYVLWHVKIAGPAGGIQVCQGRVIRSNLSAAILLGSSRSKSRLNPRWRNERLMNRLYRVPVQLSNDL